MRYTTYKQTASGWVDFGNAAEAAAKAVADFNKRLYQMKFNNEPKVALILPKLTRRQEAERWLWREYTANLPDSVDVEVQP